jgi:hypothetical protein
MDANNHNQNKIFYKNGQTWINSNFPGSLLIRPIVGENMILNTQENKIENTSQIIKFYPNPASKNFSFEKQILEDNASAIVYIYSVYGSLVSRQQVTENNVNIENLSPGLYVVKIASNHKVFTGKLIIQH